MGEQEAERRLGWNIVTGFDDEEVRDLDLEGKGKDFR